MRRFSKQKRVSVSVSLLHLPDELLLQLVDELDGGDLYALSTQCKRLQRLCLPPYLRHLGVTTPLIFPIDRLVVTPEQFPAPGIPLAFFNKNIRMLSCGIGPTWFPSRDALALQRLHRMIINTEGLENLELYFEIWYFKPLFEGEPATQACFDLLDIVAERCACLTLSGRMSALYSVELVDNEAIKWRGRSQNRPPVKGPFKALRRLLPLGKSHPRPPHIPETQLPRSYALKTLIFKSSRFLLPPFSGWAFKTLNTAALTRLDLIEVRLSSRFSALIFEAITIPTLEHLRVINCQFGLNFDSLAEFLARHNTITTFDIISWPGYAYQLPITTLPSLVSLKSNLNNIDHLLLPAGAFPKLAQVRVVVHLPPDDYFMFDAVENSFARAANRLTMTDIRLCLEVLPALRSGNLANLATLPSDLNNYPVLSRVREIVVGFPHPDVVSDTALQTWLSLFPLLEHIEFFKMPTGLDHETKISLLRRIAQKCAGIQTVKIGDETRDVSVWLSSDR